MAGHSKWANIKHRKAAQDAKRGKAFTKLIKEITVVARDGGGNPDDNPRLRTLLDKARQINMPQENSIRAIKKGTGELEGVHYESHTYEGHGPSGIAIIIETLTDNKNRSVAEIRHAFNKGGGNMGSSGSVAWMFDHLGMVKITKGNHNEDEILELLIDHDIKDINVGDDIIFVTCEQGDTYAVKKTLEDHNLTVEGAGLEWVPKETVSLEDTAAEKAIDFLHTIEDLDDVQNVYTNLG